MDRIPDSCITDCPFCVPRVFNNEEVPYCPVLDEFVYEYAEGIPEECPLIADESEEDQKVD